MSTQNGYGSIDSHPAASPRGPIDDEEEQARPGTKPGLLGRLRENSTVNVSRDWADVVLLFCYIITGLLDSSSISIWGSFVSMQTGVFRTLLAYLTEVVVRLSWVPTYWSTDTPPSGQGTRSTWAWDSRPHESPRGGSSRARRWLASAWAPSSSPASTASSRRPGAGCCARPLPSRRS